MAENKRLVIKLSRPGKDVKKAQPQDLIIDSDSLSPKVHAAGFTTLTTDASGVGSKEITHNLGYEPAVRIFMNTNPGGAATWRNDSNTGITNSIEDVNFYAESRFDKIIIYVIFGGNTVTYSFNYFIFYEEAR